MVHNILYSLFLTSLFLQPNFCYGMEPQGVGGIKRTRSDDAAPCNNGVNILDLIPPEIQRKVGEYLDEKTIARLSCADDLAFSRGSLGEFTKDDLTYDLTKVPVAYVVKILEHSCPHSLSLISLSDATLTELLPYMESLSELRIIGGYGCLSHLTAAGAAAIAQSANLSKLTSLYLVGNNIGAAGAADIAQSTTLSKLTSLDLGGNNIGDAGVEHIAQSATLSNLTRLVLMGNNIGDVGVKAIAQSSTLTKLTFLNLAINYIGDAEAAIIAQSATLQNLASLYLMSNNIGDVGAAAIAQSATLQSLTKLGLFGNSTGAEIKASLRQRFGDAVWL